MFILIEGQVMRSVVDRKGFAAVEGKGVRWYGVVTAGRVDPITTVIGPFASLIPGVASEVIYEGRIVVSAR